MKVEQDIHDKLVEVFGSDTLWISGAIKGIMQKHKLDTRDKNIVEAMMKVAIAAERSDI